MRADSGGRRGEEEEIIREREGRKKGRKEERKDECRDFGILPKHEHKNKHAPPPPPPPRTRKHTWADERASEPGREGDSPAVRPSASVLLFVRPSPLLSTSPRVRLVRQFVLSLLAHNIMVLYYRLRDGVGGCGRGGRTKGQRKEGGMEGLKWLLCAWLVSWGGRGRAMQG